MLKSDDVMNYDDVHLNVFWPYGSHAYYENNLTAAIAKFLHYSTPGTRRNFVSKCLGIPNGINGEDFRICLQRRDVSEDIESLKKRRKHVLLLRPERFLDDDSEEICCKDKHTTPDQIGRAHV
jgi:hypothetical protein